MPTHPERRVPVVLVVDDHPFNRALLARVLTNENYRPIIAASGLEAVALFQSDPPDIVLLDIHMPGMSGFEVTERLRAIDGPVRTPIVMVTASSALADRVEGIRRGADDYIMSPFETPDLLTRLTAQLRIRQLSQQLAERNIVLERQVLERTRLLHDVTFGLVAALERVNVLHDEDTGNHIRRVCEYSEALATAVGLPTYDCEQIGLWASLHDVGKVGTPHTILLKPGKLDPHEWEVMKQHAAFGYELLTTAKAPLIARNIAYTHHEKWDGNGYPKGLRADEIPIEGRVVALADVYDALTNARVYKAAWTVERAQTLFREQSGKHFDPQLIDAYFSIADSYQEIQVRLADGVASDPETRSTTRRKP